MSDGSRVVCGTWIWFVVSGAAGDAAASSAYECHAERDW